MESHSAKSAQRETLPPRSEPASTFSYSVSPAIEGALVAAAVAAVVLGYVVGGRRIQRRCPPCDRATINRFDRGALRWHSKTLGTLSYALEIAAITAPAIVSLRDRGFSKDLLKDLLVYTETFAVNSVLNVGIKTFTHRPVPLLYEGGHPDLEKKASGYRSFYSGHTAQMANALAANAVMSHLRGRRRKWPSAVAAVGTTAVAAARVGAGRHFYSDVITGAAAGAVVGSLLPLLHPAAHPAGRQGR